MNNIRLKLLLLRQQSTLKHLRGRHDQRDHNRWPAGYVAQSYVPTGRRADLMSSRMSGQFGRGIQGTAQIAMMASQVTVPWEPMKVGRNGTETIKTKEQLIERIKEIQGKRNRRRLPYGIDISEELRYSQVNYGGISEVEEIEIRDENGNWRKYFYRGTPYQIKNTNDNVNILWLDSDSSINAIVADDLSSAMGLNIAPVSQLTNQGRTVAEAFENLDTGVTANQSYKYSPSGILSNEDWLTARKELEAIAILDLLIGQSDGHSGNYGTLPVNNEDILNSSIVGFDFDYSGSSTNRQHNGSYAAMTYFGVLYDASKKFIPEGEKGFLSNEMRQLLSVIPETIQWNEGISESVRNQILDRVNYLLELDSKYDTEKPQNIQEELYQYSLDKKFDANVNVSDPYVASRQMIGKITGLWQRNKNFVESIKRQMADDAEERQPGLDGLLNEIAYANSPDGVASGSGDFTEKPVLSPEERSEINTSIKNMERFNRTLASLSAEIYSYSADLRNGYSVEDYPSIEQFLQQLEDAQSGIQDEMEKINKLLNR